jgi:hypothetical protein
MAGKRRVFGATFEATAALVAAEGDRTAAQLASHFGIHASQGTAWMERLMAQVVERFADQRPSSLERSGNGVILRRLGVDGLADEVEDLEGLIAEGFPNLAQGRPIVVDRQRRGGHDVAGDLAGMNPAVLPGPFVGVDHLRAEINRPGSRRSVASSRRPRPR